MTKLLPVFRGNGMSSEFCCLCAMDIGGTLIKVVYLEEETDTSGVQVINGVTDEQFFASPTDGAVLESNADAIKCLKQPNKVFKFQFFHTSDIDKLITWLEEKNLASRNLTLPVTGGGAFKFEETLKTRLAGRMCRCDEMASAMAGLSFLISQPSEVFRYDIPSKQTVTVALDLPLYPFILVNIGSGVSILKAESPSCFKRITGTCIGGGTVLGLARLLLGVKTFEEVVLLSCNGSNRLDLTVSDLYGDAAGSRCLPGDTLASSFGRLYVDSYKKQNKLKDIRREDVARSLINMVSYNLGYLAYLIGTIHGIRRIFFSGKFINNHNVTLQAITHSVTFYANHYRHHSPNAELHSENFNTFKEENAFDDIDCSSSFLYTPDTFNIKHTTSYEGHSSCCIVHTHLSETTEFLPMNRSNHSEQKSGFLRNQHKFDCTCRKSNSVCISTTFSSYSAPVKSLNGVSTRTQDKANITNSDCVEEKNMQSGSSQSENYHEPPESPCSPKKITLDIADPGVLNKQPDTSMTLDVNKRLEDNLFEVLFLKHDGYVGALGAMILAQHEI